MEILRVGAEKFRRQLSGLLSQVGYGNARVIVEKNGTPLAVLVPYDFYRQLEPFMDSQGKLHLPDHIGVPLSKLRAELQYAGVTYEDLREGMHRERLRTLREHYPEFYAKYIREQEEKKQKAEEDVAAAA